MPEVAHRTAFEIPWRTILKIIAAAALVWAWLQLVQLMFVVMVAVLLAVTLNPLVCRLERHGWPRWIAAASLGLALLATIGGFAWLTWASVGDQAIYAWQHVSHVERELLGRLPAWVRKAVGIKTGADLESYLGQFALRIGQSAITAVIVGLLGSILTLYLLIEGEPTRDWVLAFVPMAQRARVKQTIVESERVIFAYVAGNLLTSVLAAMFVFAMLWLLKVPAALLLALIAGVFDFVPVLGFIVSSVFAVVMALTVSNSTALAVLALYLVYHLIENYLIAPWAYGDRLKLSNVAVILAFAVGAELAGVIGALIALPIAAVYPAIERIWLNARVGPETIAEHKAIAQRSA